MAFVMEAFDGRFLDRAVHPLDLTVSPGMVRLGEPMLDIVCLADHVEAHLARPGDVAIAGLLGELDAIMGQDSVDAVGTALSKCSRNSQAVRLSALSTSWVTANLLVRSMPTSRYSLPSAVCTLAISMWKKPIG